HDSSSSPKTLSLSAAGEKHPRDSWDEEDGVQPKTPRNASPPPTILPTENIDSPTMIQADHNPLLGYLSGSDDDESDGEDFLLPDKVEQEFNFAGDLDGLDLAAQFGQFFAEIKKKAVYIEDTDELITDKNYNRSEILIEMAKSPPSDPIDRKLWVFLVGAVSKFPIKDTTKLYSESTGLSSYVLPLCQAFMGDPEKMVFLNFVDKTTVSGTSRSGTKSKREPDLVLELKGQSNETLCELGIGEGTSHAQKNNKKKNAKDLARIGLGLKDALDLIQDKYGVDDVTLVGSQVIAQTMSLYLIRRCGNMYVMVHAHDLSIPDSMKELLTIGAEYKTWFELALTVEKGIEPVLDAAAKGKVAAVHRPPGAGKARLHTVSTPELNKLLRRP
ncbi:hypothetical protein BGX34_004509, partial [Mortierella sp. NVP85]